MLKQLFLFALMLSLLVSCNNTLDIEPDYKSKTEESDMTTFFLKIDSINDKYSALTDVYMSRGYCSDYAVTTAADAVGSFVGKKLFSWVGVSIGAACGNPAVSVGGYLVGRKVGDYAGSAVASIGAAWVVNNWFNRSSSTNILVLNEDYVVSINDPNNLSDGELHNLILSKLLKNIDKYVIDDGSLNYPLLVEDALAFEKEFCPEEEYTDEFKDLWLPKAIEQTKRIVNSSSLLINCDNNAFLDDVYLNLIPEIQMTKVEFDNANILNKKTLSTYMVLDKKNIVNYSNAIDKAIDNSDFNNELKIELKSSNSVLLNSTLIWREVK